MRSYSTYKDSGIEWIGDIPIHWECVAIKHLADSAPRSFIDGDWIESKDIVYEGIRYITTGNIGPGFYKEQGHNYITDEKFQELDCTEVFPGDLIISRLNQPIGRACIIPEIGTRIVTSVDNVILRPNNSIDKRFLKHIMSSEKYFESTLLVARGATMQRISRSLLGNLKLPIPKLNEQKLIADFLDQKTSEIDQAIFDKEQLLELYEEEKKAIINQAVTKGLDPSVQMKDSGVEWLGEVPEHWEVKKLKYILKIQGRIGFKGYSKSDLVGEGDGALTIGAKHIQNNKLDLSKPEFLSWEKYYESPEIYVEPGQILVTQRGSLDKVAIIDEEIGPATINPSMLILKEVRCIPKFLFQFLVSDAFSKWIESIISGSAVPMISQEQLYSFTVCLPTSNHEQDEIVSFIETKTSTIEKKQNDIRNEIDLLKEYKQSLIFEAVTGKIDVRSHK